jgi:Golgi nucleoside diphosphatase
LIENKRIVMTPDQMQQAMNQWAQTAIAGTPLWMKALFVLQVLSMLTTTVCLPLITWKLYFGNKSAKATSLSAEQIRLQQMRVRRVGLQHLTPAQSSSSERILENPNDDSRFRPPE